MAKEIEDLNVCLFKELFADFGLEASFQKTNDKIKITCEQFDKLNWKAKTLDLNDLAFCFTGNRVELQNKELLVAGLESPVLLAEALSSVEKLLTVLKKDNLANHSFWPDIGIQKARGWTSVDDLKAGASELERLYEDDFVVKEKKPMVIDFNRSDSSYLASIKEDDTEFLDAAAQIATLALGFNDKSKSSMALRPELFQSEVDLKSWDVYWAYRNKLIREAGEGSPLKNVYFVSSGSEAAEVAIKAAQKQYPSRRKIIAFEGSFHGRTLLSLHCTYNPLKRLPFEFEKGLVDFIPFPENKSPDLHVEAEQEFINLWAHAKAEDFDKSCDKYIEQNKADSLLCAELDSLKKIREQLQREERLALVVETMLCEGGDRYATARFYQGLRLLTRVYDCPLMVDEVQVGFGLGGPFYWFDLMNLKKADGSRDWPDLLCLAKKAQLGIVLSAYEQEHKDVNLPAAYYRGLLQAEVVDEDCAHKFNKTLMHCLSALQKTIGDNLVQNIRGSGYSFAFDLPSKDIAMALIAVRFKHGLLFYPAGEKTLRFRLMATISKREVKELFASLYNCFVDLASSQIIKAKLPSLETFLTSLPTEIRDLPKEKSKQSRIESDYETLEEYSPDKWRALLKEIVNLHPQVIYQDSVALEELKNWSQQGFESCWQNYYLNEAQTSLITFLWNASRAFSDSIQLIKTVVEAEPFRSSIEELEASLYEKERRDSPDDFFKVLEKKDSVFLVAVNGVNKLQALCVASNAESFKHLPLLASDFRLKDSGSKLLYSQDLSIHKDIQGKGLGLRLKIEQLILARAKGYKAVVSRNRVPEAQAMSALNKKLAAVALDFNSKDYGGEGQCEYQSISLPGISQNNYLSLSKLPFMKNKVSLGNFVSRHYINNMLLFKKCFTKELQHLYLSSSPSEAVDKSAKLLIQKRKDKDTPCYFLSVKGEVFASNTAVARSLGGGEGAFFNWPCVEYKSDAKEFVKEVQSCLEQNNHQECLGFYLDSSKKSKEWLNVVVEFLKSRQIPVVLKDNGFGPSIDEFFVSNTLVHKPDILVGEASMQLAWTACNMDFFMAKPLMMISTWESDEHSLNLLRERLLAYK